MATFPAPRRGSSSRTSSSPPADPDRVSSFLNIRVADIHAVYEGWRGRSAEFLTSPTDRGVELRCYTRGPDGHLIEVGQRIPPQEPAA